MTFTPQSFSEDVWAEHRRSEPPQHALVADVLDGFTPIGEVPDNFTEFVQDRIAARPSPAVPDDVLARVEAKLDEVLTLLRGTTE